MDDAQKLMLYDANKKSVLVAYLLWFFLGSLGAHRFYAGRTGLAVALLIITLVSIPLAFVLVGFLGIAVVSIWVLIDAFLIPGMIGGHNLALAMVCGR